MTNLQIGLVAISITSALSIACSSGLPADNNDAGAKCPVGAESCTCGNNNTCNAGLTCASHICVNLGTGGNGAAGGTTSNATTSAGGSSNAGASATTGGSTATVGGTGTGGYGVPGQSCNGMTGTECNGESCCTSIPVPAGTFPMGRGAETCSNCTNGCPGGMTCNADEMPEHNVTVSAFSLDKYEVTVGRFRRFVDANDKMNAPPPVNGGANPNISGTGWWAAWNGNMPANAAAFKSSLKCDSIYPNWTDSAGNNETYPINCVNWYEAFAFCIWDGGRLPTEAEWEYAAAGGDENRLYPWGASPAPSCSLANYSGCVGNVAVVGNYASGQGRWGHMDLAGNVWEWVFDYYAAYNSATCANCATTSGTYRVYRGGGWYNNALYLRSAARDDGRASGGGMDASDHGSVTGIRCARNQ